ncbi:unnamed protein product, partial [marine sediment metagenome]
DDAFLKSDGFVSYPYSFLIHKVWTAKNYSSSFLLDNFGGLVSGNLVHDAAYMRHYVMAAHHKVTLDSQTKFCSPPHKVYY